MGHRGVMQWAHVAHTGTDTRCNSWLRAQTTASGERPRAGHNATCASGHSGLLVTVCIDVGPQEVTHGRRIIGGGRISPVHQNSSPRRRFSGQPGFLDVQQFIIP